jgi:hypothetical protein
MNRKPNDQRMAFTLARQGHFWAGMAICLSSPIQFLGWGVVTAVGIAILKEVYWNWQLGHDNPDITNVIWATIGALCALGMHNLGAVPYIVAGVM